MGHARRRPKRLAEKLLQIRKHYGLSQSGLVKALGLSIHYNFISKFELDKNEPEVSVLLAYCRYANIPLEQLVDDDLDLDLT
jgi:transcriptional regulator with XRE-family HTH domain